MTEIPFSSTAPELPGLAFALDVRLQFSPLPRLVDVPAGGSKGIVVVHAGRFEGPRLKGTVVPSSGGDLATFRDDGVVALDARYLLLEDDGTPIVLHNRGFIWGRTPDVMPRFSRIANGKSDETVEPAEYYFRTMTSFDAPKGKHDWLCRHAFIGTGMRLKDGNQVRYFAIL